MDFIGTQGTHKYINKKKQNVLHNIDKMATMQIFINISKRRMCPSNGAVKTCKGGALGYSSNLQLISSKAGSQWFMLSKTSKTSWDTQSVDLWWSFHPARPDTQLPADSNIAPTSRQAEFAGGTVLR